MDGNAVEETRTCRKCGETKALEAFDRRPDGRRAVCKACISEARRAAYAPHPRWDVSFVDGEKPCKTCGVYKPPAGFREDPRRPGHHHASCKACKYARDKAQLQASRPKKPAPAQAFEMRVDRSGGADACHLWIGARFPNGYGKWSDSKMQYAHRAAWSYANGRSVPDGMDILHSCDGRYPIGDITNRRCCNPAHLRPGTKSENARDMYERNRYPVRRGEAACRSKLTAAKVRDIRKRHDAGESQTTLAAEYGVTPESIHAAVRFKSWKHIA